MYLIGYIFTIMGIYFFLTAPLSCIHYFVLEKTESIWVSVIFIFVCFCIAVLSLVLAKLIFKYLLI